MPTLVQDLQHAFRSLRKRAGFTIAAVATIAVGIGANVTVFSLVDALLLRPLPFGDRSERVVTLHSTHRLQPQDWDDSGLSFPDLLDVRAEARSFEHVGGMMLRNFTVTTDAEAERLLGLSVTPDVFPGLGVQPILGRLFVESDAAAPGLESTVLLTHGLWQRRFGGDPEIVGRSVVINDRARTVIGVMPPGFKFPHRAELYMALRWDEAPRSARTVAAIGVLRPDASIPAAQAELDAIAARLEAKYPDINRGYGIRLLSFRESNVGGGARVVAVALMAAVGFVLLIACANLTNLLLVHGAARRREMAVRAAIGASRARLLWLLLSESVLLASLGAAAGVLGTVWALDWMRAAVPEELPYWYQVGIDGRMIVFTVLITALTTIAIGLLPALRASTPQIVETLKDGGREASMGRGAQRTQSTLAVVQVALCLALLVGASLMIRTVVAMQTADLGFDHSTLLSARAYLAGDAYDEVPARGRFFIEAVDRLRALPGVTAVAATTSIPGDDGGAMLRIVAAEDRREADLSASSIGVTAGLFDALGLRMIEGRPFSPDEVIDPESQAVIVNARLAARLWPNQSALDRPLGVRGAEGVEWHRVVGVVPDVHYEEVGEETDASQMNVYVPYAASGSRTMAFLVRAERAPETLVQPVRDALRRLNPGLPLYEVMPMSERRRFTTWELRFMGQMMGAFAAIALLLACLGIYALLSYAARRRTQEIGIRLALGARPRDVVMLFVRQGGTIAAAGLLAGLALAIGIARLLSSVVWGVRPFDAAWMAALGAALLIVVLMASYWPARRASRVDPMNALRTQ